MTGGHWFSNILMTRKLSNTKETKKKKILETARHLFFEKGYENATIEDVAEHAGMAKGTFYNYFASKEELCAVLSAQALEKIYELVEEQTAQERTGLDKIQAIGKIFERFYTEYPAHFLILKEYEDVFAHEFSHTSAEVVNNLIELKKKGIAIIQHMLEQGMQDGSVRTDIDTLKTALIIMQTSRMFITQTLHQERCMVDTYALGKQEVVSYFFTIIRQAIET